jgi:hypothetical protein
MKTNRLIPLTLMGILVILLTACSTDISEATALSTVESGTSSGIAPAGSDDLNQTDNPSGSESISSPD